MLDGECPRKAVTQWAQGSLMGEEKEKALKGGKGR